MSRKTIDARGAVRRTSARLATLLRPRTVVLGEAGGDVDLVVESFRQWCAAHAGAACEIALSSRWVVTCVPPAGAGAMTAQELRQYARRQVAYYFDDAQVIGGAGWMIATSIRKGVVLACAVRADLVSRLKASADVHQVSIRRMFPWWAATVAPLEGASHEVVVAEPGITAVFQFTQGRLHRVETTFDVDQMPGDAIRLWTGDRPMPPVCDAPTVSALVASSAWRPHTFDIELLESPARASLASWLLLLVAVACALVESNRADGLRQAKDREQAMLDRIQASHARTRQAAHPASGANGSKGIAEAKAIEAAIAMLSLQQHPWADVFAGVEAAGDNVALLSLQHDASQSAVDIELAVPNDDAAWSFAERMASDTRRFSSATLLTRQTLEATAGALGERARVQAVLVADLPVSQRGAR